MKKKGQAESDKDSRSGSRDRQDDSSNLKAKCSKKKDKKDKKTKKDKSDKDKRKSKKKDKSSDNSSDEETENLKGGESCTANSQNFQIKNIFQAMCYQIMEDNNLLTSNELRIGIKKA